MEKKAAQSKYAPFAWTFSFATENVMKCLWENTHNYGESFYGATNK